MNAVGPIGEVGTFLRCSLPGLCMYVRFVNENQNGTAIVNLVSIYVEGVYGKPVSMFLIVDDSNSKSSNGSSSAGTVSISLISLSVSFLEESSE